ncbi:FeoC-like transcriptional regulator [Plantactinospora siamensis]|uniref:FeoC-like transcriptional regulator n=1 Tax=Plantactinospora siamensis TaxID=555372 RepID=A0ABV6NT67_9ACTN
MSASPLRRVLAEIRAAERGGVSLDDVARRVGVGRDEIDSMVDYWVRKGRLTVEEIGRGCPSGGCGGCSSGKGGSPGCGTPTAGGPVLLGITIARRPGTDG